MLGLLTPAVAQADLTWSSARPISPTGTTSSGVRVATDAAGDAVAVWRQFDSTTGTDRIAWSYRPSRGNFGNWSYVTDATTVESLDPQVAMNASGEAIVTWTRDVIAGHDIAYAVRYPGDVAFGDAKHLLGPSNGQSSSVALDAAGDAVIAFQRVPSSAPYINHIAAAYRPAGVGTNFGTEQTVSSPPGGGEDPDATAPKVAMNAKGDSLVAWQAYYAFPGDPSYTNELRVDASYRAAGASSFLPKQTISTPGYATHHTIAFDPQPALDPAGNAMVSYPYDDHGTWSLAEASRPAGPSAFSGQQTIAATSDDVRESALAFDPSGGARAVWADPASGTPTSGIQSAYRPPGGSFGPPTQAAPTGVKPHVGIDAQGRPAALWSVDPGTGSYSVQVSSRGAAGAGPFAALTPLATDVDFGGSIDTHAPDLSVSAAGQAVAAWSETDSGDVVIQASFGTPPGQAPPPPPPPPPAPVPSAIVAAAPFEKGKAIVLTAKVSGPVDRLEWDLGRGPKVIGTVVDGTLQDSVRFRPDPGRFVASVTAIGPGGRRTYSRSLSAPQALHDADTNAVASAIRAAPDVYAAGDAATLVGGGAGQARAAAAGGGASKCGPVSLFTGEQTIAGCMKPVPTLPSIPAREQGAIKAVADNLGLDPTDEPLMKAAMQRLDGYDSEGRTMLNDQWPVVPKSGADVMSFPEARALTSSSASIEVAGQKFGASPQGFSLDLDPRRANIPLGDLPKPPQLPSIGGFELVGDWNVDLRTREATIKASLKLPNFITKAGVQIQNSVTLRATPDRLIVDNVSIGPIKVDLGTLGVSGFKIAYDRPSDTWTGQGKVCLLTGACLDMVPPNGEVKIQHGRLNFAGASIDFPLPGVPLFAGVNLESIGFGLGLDPTRLTGRGRIAVVKLVKLDGRLVTAFPSAATPFHLRADEVGGDFPAKLYGTEFTRPTIGATAAVIVSLPELGTITLGHGYFLYEYPSYIALGGGVDVNLFDVVDVHGAIAGEANFDDKTVNFHGDVRGCIHVGLKVCAGAVANVSHGPHSAGGAGACLNVGDINVGGGVQWAHVDDPLIWPFDGCKWSRFAIEVRAGRAGVARAAQTMVVRRGQPNPALKLYGDGAAPLVRVEGPGGQRLDSTEKGLDLSPGGKIRVLRFQGRTRSFTVVGLQDARPGVYRVSPLPGSVAISAVGRAFDPPDAFIRARVSGRGAHRLLTYRLRRRPGQRVLFEDIEPGGATRGIGQAGNRAHGRLRFTAPPGPSRRRIVAQFLLAGVPAERRVIATYRPPPAALSRPRHLRLVRGKRGVALSWRRVGGATRYEVSLTDNGFQRFSRGRRTRVLLRRIPRWIGGRITVRAVDATRQSRPAAVRLRAAARKPRRLTHLGKCRLHRRAISCQGVHPHKKQKKHKRRPKRHRKG